MDRRGFLAGAMGGLAGLALPWPAAASTASRPGPWGPPPLTLRYLTDDPAFVDSRPCVSPSGDRVLFQRAPAGSDPVRTANSNSSPWSLWTIPASGGRPELLFEDGEIRATRPDWHWPSGRIAFSGVREGRGGVWTLARDGTDLRAVHRGDPPLDQLFYPSWYPGGDAIAVTDYRTQQVLRIDVATGGVEPLTDPGTLLAGMCSVAPDPDAEVGLALAGQRPGDGFAQSQNTIWLRGSGGAVRELDGLHGRMPAWSPDGRFLAFMSNRPRSQPAPTLHHRGVSDGVAAIFITEIGPDGVPVGSTQGVTPFDQATLHAKWFPDGRSLACVAHDPRSERSGIAVIELA